jgi:hypothetical protein
MTISFQANKLYASNIEVNLDEVRDYLLDTQPTLCINKKIKTIISNGQPLVTYDWESIFDISKKAGYLTDFILDRITKANDNAKTD